MYLIYCDESGNTGRRLNDREQPCHLLLALLVEETQWLAVHRDFIHLKQSALETLGLSANTELHAVDILQHKGPFQGCLWPARETLIRNVLQLVTAHCLDIVWCAVDKPRLACERSWTHPHDVAFMHVATACQLLLDETPQHGLFIADEAPGCQQMLRSSLKEYQEAPVPMDRVLDTIHFARSSDSSFLQICDLCAYFTRRAVVRDALDTDPYYQLIAPRVRSATVWPPENGETTAE